MAKTYISEEMIAEVRRIGAFNDVESDGRADADVLNALDQAMLDEVLPSLVMVQEEYLVRTKSVTTSANQEFVDIPSRAVGGVVRDVYWRNGTSRHYVPRIHREHRMSFSEDAADVPDGIYIEGDHLVLVPKSTGGQTIELAYIFRPGQLVKSTGYRRVASVDSSTSVTLDSAVPAAWTTSSVFDVHSAKSGAETRAYDLAASVVSGTGITFTTAIDGTADDSFAVEVGDYVVLAETAAVPALPREAHPILAQAAACRLLESDGDAVALEIARQTLARQILSFTKMTDTRIEGKPQKILNPWSFLSRQSSGGSW